jgi:hypothetical protein
MDYALNIIERSAGLETRGETLNPPLSVASVASCSKNHGMVRFLGD